MENLNAEQIKKALECFHQRILDTNLAEKVTEAEIMAVIDALALITSQEQRIKELTEEVASWKEIAEGYQKQFEDCAEDRAKLTEENDAISERYAIQVVTAIKLDKQVQRLTEENERLADNLIKQSTENIMLLIDKRKIKSDTVRKMRKEIAERCIKGGIYPAFVKSTIDQIATEILEEDK